ncbi:MAG: hypothetical protein ACE5E9_05195 [Nitrospinaceae bacterium]
MTLHTVKKLNQGGIQRFREYLLGVRSGAHDSPPEEILHDPLYSEEVQGQGEIENVTFKSSFEAAKYLNQKLVHIDNSNNLQNIGLWSWLSLFYFDQVCPPDNYGSRNPGRDYRHIPEMGYRFRHRHLLAGPFHTYKMYEEKARLLLNTPLRQESQIHHQLATRQNFISNRAIIDAIGALYFDEELRKPKKGLLSKAKPGNLYRFIDVVQQLDLTYDLYSMKSDEIFSLLPEEFKGWQ